MNEDNKNTLGNHKITLKALVSASWIWLFSSYTIYLLAQGIIWIFDWSDWFNKNAPDNLIIMWWIFAYTPQFFVLAIDCFYLIKRSRTAYKNYYELDKDD